MAGFFKFFFPQLFSLFPSLKNFFHFSFLQTSSIHRQEKSDFQNLHLKHFNFIFSPHIRLKTFISTAVMPYRSQLETILFPMFASVYLEMLCNGQKVPGWYLSLASSSKPAKKGRILEICIVEYTHLRN